jgi:hypothetical protein
MIPAIQWKLPPSDAGTDEARVSVDGSKFTPAIIDHEENVLGYTDRGNLERESTGTIGIHRICAREGQLEYVAVCA